MSNELGNTAIRELSADELVDVSGGKVCAYRAAGQCYVYRDLNLAELVMLHINYQFTAVGQPGPFPYPGV